MTNLRVWLEEKSPEELEHFLEETPRLLLEGGELKKLQSLLSNYEFIEAKINNLQFGIQALIEDYSLLETKECLKHPEYNPEVIKSLNLIPNSLFRSAHILEENKNQLAAQLSGRLLHFTEQCYINKLVKQISRTKTFCLRCLTASLNPPGTPLVRTLSGHSSFINTVAITKDNKYVVSGSWDKTIKVWELATGKKINTFSGHSSFINTVAITTDNKYVVSGSDDKKIKVWELATGREINTLSVHSFWVNTVAITKDNKYVVSGSDDKKIKVWELATGREINTLYGHISSVNTVAITKDNKYVVSGSDDKQIKVWELATGKEINTLSSHSGWVNTIAITTDNKYVVSGSDDKQIKVWELATGKEINTLYGHSSSVNTVALTTDNKYVVSGSWDDTIKVWELATGKEINTLSSHSSSVNTVALTKDNKYVVSGSDDKQIKVWELATGKEIKTFSGHTDWVNTVALTKDNKYVVSGSWDNTIKVWELTTGKEINTLYGHTDWVNTVALTKDNKNKGSRKKTIKEWELNTGKVIKTLSGYSDWVNTIALTKGNKNKYVVSGSWDNTIKVWELATGKLIKTLVDHSGWVNTVAITTDDKYVVSGSRDKTIKVWELATGKNISTLFDHSDSVSTLAITTDDKYVVSGSRDKTIKVWELATGKETLTFTADASITCCAIAPDDQTIVAGDASGRVHFLRWENKEKPSFKVFSTAFNNFLNNHNRGYFTLVGFPGSGKTSILTQYAQFSPSVVYFNPKLTKKNTAQEFLPHLCHQLSDKFPFLPSIPQPTTEGSWLLSQLLQQISDQLSPRQKLIIAIDSLDAINPHSQPPGTNLLYLPRYLPQGIYFILARRPFKPDQSGLLIEAPAEILDLSQYEVENWENEANYQEHWQKIQGEGLSDIARQVLQVLTAADDEGVSLREIVQITQGDGFDIQELLDNWYEFLRLQPINQETRYSWYHPNFRDWLRDS